MKKKQHKIASTKVEWAKKVVEPHGERLAIYFSSALREAPQKYQKETRFYWLIAITLNIASLAFVLTSFYIPINRNLNNEVKLIRVDGKIVNEAKDQRREVYINNIIRRVEITKEAEEK